MVLLYYKSFKVMVLIIEQDPLLYFVEKHGFLEILKNIHYININGIKLIELCKMSNLKIGNGGIGKDRGVGH